MSAAAALEQPKKFQTAYWMWLMEHRAEVVEKCGSRVGSAVAKCGGEMWRALPAAQKEPFERRSAEAKKVYGEQMAAFKEAGGVCKRKGDDLAAPAAKDENAPKKPGSSYWQFCKANRSAIVQELGPVEGKKTPAVSRRAGEKWKAMTDAQRRPYEEQQQKLMEEYREQLAAYKASGGAAASEGAAEEEDAGTAEAESDESEGSPSPAKKPRTAKADKPAAVPAPKAKAKAKANRPIADEPAATEELKEQKTSEAGPPPAKKPSPVKKDAPPKKEVLTQEQRMKAGDMADVLEKLAKRDDIKQKRCTVNQMIKALRSNKGQLHPTKRALLGA